MSDNLVIEVTLDPRQREPEVSHDGRLVTVGAHGALLGRGQTECDVLIDLPYVSRKHARVTHYGEVFFIEDLKSVDGTLLNGKPIDPRRKYSLLNDDTVTIGDRLVHFSSVPWWEPAMEGELSMKGEPAMQNEPAMQRERPEADPPKAPSPGPAQEMAAIGEALEPATAGGPPITRPGESPDVELTAAVPAMDSPVVVNVDLMRAFMQGLQLKPELVPEEPEQMQRFMELAGHLLFISVDGIRKALYTQDRFRDQYRIPGTVLSRSHMNPLYNHQINTRSVIEVLFAHSSSSAIVDPVMAVQEATRDFYVHGVAVPVAVDQAIRAVFKTFDWRALKEVFDGRAHSALIGPLKKAHFWDCLCDEYDRRVKTLDEFDNEYRRAVATAYAQERSRSRANNKPTGDNDAE